MEKLDALKESVIEREVKKTAGLTQKALDKGLSPEEILTQALIPALRVVGEQYERGEIFIPEMLLAARAVKGAMEILKPRLAESGVESKGRVVIGTVKGDLHDIGMNLVAMMLEGAGFEVHNLGIDVSVSQFVEAAKEDDADIVGMSALLTTTLVYMPQVIKALEENRLRDRVKAIIGGAPVTQKYADKIGADGYAQDAASAVKLVERLITAKSEKVKLGSM